MESDIRAQLNRIESKLDQLLKPEFRLNPNPELTDEEVAEYRRTWARVCGFASED